MMMIITMMTRMTMMMMMMMMKKNPKKIISIRAKFKCGHTHFDSKDSLAYMQDM